MKSTLNTKAVILLLLAVSFPAFGVTQSDVVGYWTFNFQPGFNLVAFPVLPNTPTLQSVIGDRLGEVEITTYDSQLRNYRWARYNPESASWTGNLYLLARGSAYWVNVIGDDAKRLVVTGHPELYTKFRWIQLRFGWQYYAPTYGKSENLAQLPPAEPRDLLLGWDPINRQFALAEATADLRWHSRSLSRIDPDRSYIALLHHKPLRSFGPPLEIEAQYAEKVVEPQGPERDSDGPVEFTSPPEPLVVGNARGLAICTPDGRPCDVGLTVFVVRESMRIGIGGELEPVEERLTRHEVLPNPADAGRFRIALAIGEGLLTPGDRIHLLVRDGRGGETRSTSFEVPADDRILDNITFTEPLRTPDNQQSAPVEFTLGSPFPNPFNDRFSVEVRLPEATPVTVRLVDVNGRVALERQSLLAAGSHRLTIPSGTLSSGIYMMKVTAGNRTGMAKVAHLK
jgi:hypothetical protein